MKLPFDNMEQARNSPAFVWVMALILFIIGYKFLRDFLLFILTKLYEYFIQHNATDL